MDAGFGKSICNERYSNSVDQSCDGFVATTLELRRLYQRVRHYSRLFGVEAWKRAGVELFRTFTLLNVLSPESMVYYAKCVGAYRAVAPLVQYREIQIGVLLFGAPEGARLRRSGWRCSRK